MRKKGQLIDWQLFHERCSKGHPHIVVDPKVMDGMPHLAGTMIPITLILARARAFGNFQALTDTYPEISREQIEEALSYAETFIEMVCDERRAAP